MFLLDTSFISETRKPRPNRGAVAWDSLTPPALIFTSALVIGELELGVARAPDETRARALRAWIDDVVLFSLAGKVLPFDVEAAIVWGRMFGPLERIGRRPGLVDSQIAATAISQQLTVVTRNVSDFQDFDVPVLNPWDD